MLIAESPKTRQKKFTCIKCDYNTSKESDYNKHLNTAKHSKLISDNEKLIEKSHIFKCSICNKEYKSNVGLWKHKKKCKLNEETITPVEIINDPSNNVIKLLINENKELINENKEFKNLILEMMKSNNDLHQKMFELCKNTNTNNNNTTINTNSHNINNKTFNLQVFLNEECKDAMNMTEFINSIQLKLSDLENIGNQGYIEGVSNILINHLNNTEMYKRPVHCSDAKRETLYVKEENKWEKEGPDNKKMKRAVLGLEKKNFLMLNQWKEKYPKCMDSESTQSDTYMKMISKLMNGDEENINKVIKKVAKEVVIEK
jgi:hypothetical protein